MVLASAEQEAGYHVPHQILIAQRYHVEVGLPEILGVGKQCGKKAIAAFSREAKNEHPVKKPLRLVKHLHRELTVASLDDVL